MFRRYFAELLLIGESGNRGSHANRKNLFSMLGCVQCWGRFLTYLEKYEINFSIHTRQIRHTYDQLMK